MEGGEVEQLSEVDLKVKEFDGMVREVVILCLISIILYIGSFAFLNLLRREKDEEFLPYTDTSDFWVYRISLWCCSFSLAVSVGAAMLLPISSISNEVLHRYPNSWYIKWLNSSLIHGIWNLLFTLTNVTLFLLLPFAYLFCESEGFTGARRGLWGRAKETLVTLLLLSVVVCGFIYIISAVVDRDQNSIDTLVSLYSYYLPFLYSCVSFLGVLLLLVCTPLGFVKLFSLVGELVTRQQLGRDLQGEHQVAVLEEAAARARLEQTGPGQSPGLVRLAPALPAQQDSEHLQQQLAGAVGRREAVERALQRSRLVRQLAWPSAMLGLIALTGICLYLVITNITLLAAGFRALPSNHNTSNIDLGNTSLSTMGVLGVVTEVIIIAYLLLTSIIGLYSIPALHLILPAQRDTSITHLIYNCALYVILSSALPLLVKVLGITNFDLLGNYGKIRWLGNYFLIFAVNFLFAAAAALCLFNKVTQKAQQEIWRRISHVVSGFKQNVVRRVASWCKDWGLQVSQKLPSVSSPIKMKAE